MESDDPDPNGQSAEDITPEVVSAPTPRRFELNADPFRNFNANLTIDDPEIDFVWGVRAAGERKASDIYVFESQDKVTKDSSYTENVKSLCSSFVQKKNQIKLIL